MFARRIGIVSAVIAIIAAALAGRVEADPADGATTTCTNPASGASWQINIDYDKATVDSYPAHINQAEISWHDNRDGGNYTLDRRSGELTVVVASSTGGYFLHDRCSLESSGTRG